MCWGPQLLARGQPRVSGTFPRSMARRVQTAPQRVKRAGALGRCPYSLGHRFLSLFVVVIWVWKAVRLTPGCRVQLWWLCGARSPAVRRSAARSGARAPRACPPATVRPPLPREQDPRSEMRAAFPRWSGRSRPSRLPARGPGPPDLQGWQGLKTCLFTKYPLFLPFEELREVGPRLLFFPRELLNLDLF